MSRVAIVTLPFHFNYGGILQAYALQRTILSLGCKVEFFTCPSRGVKGRLKAWLYANTPHGKFVRNYFHCVEKDAPFEVEDDISTIVVGSDQVWRSDIGVERWLSRFFLETNKSCNKVAYAASFGRDSWHYSDEEERKARELLNEFSAVSVREESGKQLCCEHFNLKNTAVTLDPTLLIDWDNHPQLISSPFHAGKKHLFVYLLDYKNERNRKFEAEFLLKKNMEVVRAKVERNPIKRWLSPALSVEKWLGAVRYADIMITDSFHGCVFSILFHTPFVVLKNEVGGVTRIFSLLEMFGLQNRLVDDEAEIDALPPIDWSKVDEVLKEKRAESLQFLTNSIR